MRKSKIYDFDSKSEEIGQFNTMRLNLHNEHKNMKIQK